MVLVKKKKNRTYIYNNFYLDFKEFATSLMEKKGINKKQMMTQTEKFYFLMSEKNVKMSKLKKLKDMMNTKIQKFQRTIMMNNGIY